MAEFEVFIPAADEDGFNITAHIQADTWIQALRSGLSKLGDTADVKNIMVDIKETGIEVTERIPCQPPPGKRNLSYLKAKKKKLGHLLAV